MLEWKLNLVEIVLEPLTCAGMSHLLVGWAEAHYHLTQTTSWQAASPVAMRPHLAVEASMSSLPSVRSDESDSEPTAAAKQLMEMGFSRDQAGSR